jgi:hypothetical protein
MVEIRKYKKNLADLNREKVNDMREITLTHEKSIKVEKEN